MANVIVALKIMPKGIDSDLGIIEQKVKEIFNDFGGEVGKVEHEPIAFGLKAIKVFFVMDESKGFNEEELISNISKISDVSSSEVIDVRRAIG